MLINEGPKSILVLRQDAMETKGLLRLGQPLQQGVHHRVEFLRLQVHTDTRTPNKSSKYA